METREVSTELLVTSTNVNPAAAALLLLMCLVMFFGSRRAAVNSMLGIAAFLPLGQQFMVLGLNFQFFRILILVGFCRVFLRGETALFKMNGMDRLFICWAFVGAVCGAIREPSAIFGVDCMGMLFNALGTFFLMRILIRDPRDIKAHLIFLSFALMVMGLAMVVEQSMARNPFAVFGGVREMVQIRDGRLRCQGPFRSPILAGTFAATLAPLLIAFLLQARDSRFFVSLGTIACGFVTVAASSSGALLTLLTEIAGFMLWPVRRKMRWVRRGMVAMIVLLAMVMNAPVWYLTARLSDLVGGTGWHRAYLIDQAVAHFNEWWLFGTSYTAHWGPGGEVLEVDPNNMDITNHYIAQGIQGGVLRMALFIAFIVGCFKIVGRAMKVAKFSPLKPLMIWALGISLAGHCMAFISVSYFDQIEIFWYWLLAVIVGMPVGAWEKEAREAAALKKQAAGTRGGSLSESDLGTLRG
jgi:hypothetical protein